MKNLRIAGIVTLYNPTDDDINNISTYINEIDKLYIIDNTEGTSNEDRIPKNKKIEYIFNNENIGVASALNLGAKLAIKDGFNWLLTNDQDTSFKKGVIDKMKSVILNENTKDIGIITPWHNTRLLIEKPKEEYDYPFDVMTSGNIINLDIWKKIGGFKDWLFIDGIDIEYCMNLHLNGYKILRINTIEIDHNLGDIFYKKIGKKNFFCSNHVPIRRYYIMRNYHYICDIYKNELPKEFMKLLDQSYNIKCTLLFEKNKIKKLKMYLRGYLDYKKGIKGKYPYNN